MNIKEYAMFITLYSRIKELAETKTKDELIEYADERIKYFEHMAKTEKVLSK